MRHIPLFVTFSLFAFGYSQEMELQTVSATSKGTTEALPHHTQSSDYETSIQKALAWLITQREHDWGWRNDTPKVLIALQLAQNEDVSGILPTYLETQLSMKQMEVEIVTMLWRHHEVPITPPRLAQYSLALNSLCQDPRQFHGHDLIGTLQHHEPTHDLEFAYSTLAACSARAHVRKKQIRRLLDIANSANNHNIDTVAMTILALRCIVKDHRHRNLQHSIRRPSISLAKQQQPDGGFGNLYNTALVIQALQDGTSESNTYWNRSIAISYIEARQDPDGAFTDPGLTADVLLALTSRGLGFIRNSDCDKSENDYENHVDLDGLQQSMGNHANDSEIRNVTITYTLWVGTNVTENSTISLIAPRNTSFYNVMQMAMEQDSHYTFEATEWPNGHYVHTIAGFKEEPAGYHYWLLYRLPELPDPSAPPANQLVAPVGVDALLIEEGDHYLFWYKKL